MVPVFLRFSPVVSCRAGYAKFSENRHAILRPIQQLASVWVLSLETLSFSCDGALLERINKSRVYLARKILCPMLSTEPACKPKHEGRPVPVFLLRKCSRP